MVLVIESSHGLGCDITIDTNIIPRMSHSQKYLSSDTFKRFHVEGVKWCTVKGKILEPFLYLRPTVRERSIFSKYMFEGVLE